MITCMLGRPGGGKSYEIVRYHLLPALLKDKRKVVTNLPLKLDYISKVHGAEYSELVTVIDGNFHDFGGQRPFSEAEHFTKYDWQNDDGVGTLFIIDEAHLPLGRNAKQDVTEYLSMHRHYGHDIILATQNQRKLNRDIRDMVEVGYYCAKMQVFGEDGYVRKTYHGLGNMRDALHTEERQYDPEYFPYYQSHTKSKTSVTEEAVKDSKGSRNPYKWWSIGMIATGVVFAAITFAGMISPEASEVQEQEQDVSVLVEPTPAESQVPVPRPVPERLAQVESSSTETVNYSDTKLGRAKREADERDAEKSAQHPFDKVILHLDGRYNDYGNGDTNVFFSASMNGQRVFKLELRDLLMAGYSVTVLGDCVVELIHGEYRDFVICDSPSVGVGLEADTVSST